MRLRAFALAIGIFYIALFWGGASYAQSPLLPEDQRRSICDRIDAMGGVAFLQEYDEICGLPQREAALTTQWQELLIQSLGQDIWNSFHANMVIAAKRFFQARPCNDELTILVRQELIKEAGRPRWELY